MDEAHERVIRETRALNREQGGGIDYEPPRRERQYPRSEDNSDVLHESGKERRWAPDKHPTSPGEETVRPD